MAASNIVSLFRPRQTHRDWSNQELAEFYRVESALVSVGFRVDTDRGLSDEGEPWFIFADANTGDVIVHCARTDGGYLVASPAFNSVLRGMDFRSLVESFLERQPLVLPPIDTQQKKSNISLHPSVLLVALVATAFFQLSTSNVEAAEDEADDDEPAAALAAQDGLEFDRQQALVVLAAVAVVTGQLRNDGSFAWNDGWPLLSNLSGTEDDVYSRSAHDHADNTHVSRIAQELAANRNGDNSALTPSATTSGSDLTRYSAGKPEQDLLVADGFGVTTAESEAPAPLNPLEGPSLAPAGGTSGYRLTGTDPDAIVVNMHDNPTSSPSSSEASGTTDGNGDQGASVAGESNAGVSRASDIDKSAAVAAAADNLIHLSAKISPVQVVTQQPAQAPEGALADVIDDPEPIMSIEIIQPVEKTPVAETPVVPPVKQPEPEPEPAFDVDALLAAVAPRLSVNVDRIKYTDDVYTFDDTVLKFIGSFARQEGRLASMSTGHDVVIYDPDLPLFGKQDINLVTWSLDDGSTISLIGVFDYDPVI